MLPVKIFSSLFFLLFSSLSFRFHNVIYFFLLYNLSFFFLFNFFLSCLNLFENGKSNQFFTQSNTNPKLGCFFLLHEKSTKRNGNKISNPIVKLINIKDRIKHDKKKKKKKKKPITLCESSVKLKKVGLRRCNKELPISFSF
jgi:hypothetical protein